MMECKFKEETSFRHCEILNVVRCPKNCKFRKTELEFNEAQRKAQSILDAKGLVFCQLRDENGVVIMSTRSAK